ncbi:MAG TPA: hypothetical protein PLP61_13185 [Nocardioides sp.]|uniref:hypothetical protein n=1 Tax=Nocardioides sp. TaxID=35761 RepID=UPI002C2E9144|nr:hypothetical protein [Nocardioides sp.]HQR27987.1 hypothetical protein [Nocardioides sp.]
MPKDDPLPDALLFCGPGLEVAISDFTFPTVGAGVIWLNDAGAYFGRWNFLEFEHYGAPGYATAPVPRAELEASYAPLPGGKSFGVKAGMDQTLECQIVSRYRGATPDEDFTVFGPLTLGRAN